MDECTAHLIKQQYTQCMFETKGKSLTSNGVGLVCTIFLVCLRDRMGWDLKLNKGNRESSIINNSKIMNEWEKEQ